eukprot:TRINITY_DN5467_c0_g1_i1.p1 TRINITY_DN5467_c0_g1~~TRINITY_DN5467_c0_g1_i1.p1  ORF type:complete len:563 (-),score=82.60 TRINITY_DN5467_c0_g1_i1:43-1731(-)
MYTLALCLFVSLIVGISALNDPQRPQFHFLPASNWMNDPNGPMYYNGFYHLFYQYNPNAPVWGEINWGHSYSKDLVHWTYLPIALSPTPGGYDQNGCFSGSATLTSDPSMPILIVYTCISPTNEELQCLAFPSDINDPSLTNWTKYENNPVMTAPKMDLDGYRDPTTAWFNSQDNKWYLIIGAGETNDGGMTLLYSSEDLLSWNFTGHPLYFDVEHSAVTGSMWECPDFYQVSDDFYALKFSNANQAWDMYYIGSYFESNNTFQPNTLSSYDNGKFYASKTFWDFANERRILFGWISEEDSNATARGWSGMQSLPRVVTFDADTNSLVMNPIPELQSLRGQQTSFSNLVVSNKNIPLNITGGDQAEIVVNFLDIEQSVTEFGIRVRTSPTLSETTLISIFLPQAPLQQTDLPGLDYHYHTMSTLSSKECNNYCINDPLCIAWTVYMFDGITPMCTLKYAPPTPAHNNETTSGFRGYVCINRTNSSLAKDVERFPFYAPVIGTLSNVHIFVDHSVIEVFINNGFSVLTSRIYPTLSESQGVEVFSVGGKTTVSIDFYQLAFIW